MPSIIEDVVITAKLIKDTYEYRKFGTFRITITQLVSVCDETSVNTADTVIGPLRYYVAGSVKAEVFEANEE